MEHAFQILVIILSGMLAIFLLLAIVVTVSILKLIKELRMIADKGAMIASRAETLTSSLVESVTTSRFLKAVAGLVRTIRKFK